jgi:hypothetical protein
MAACHRIVSTDPASYEWVERRTASSLSISSNSPRAKRRKSARDNITPITLIELPGQSVYTAKRLKKTQEPYFAVDGGTSGNIVLAVNKRKLRLKREWTRSGAYARPSATASTRRTRSTVHGCQDGLGLCAEWPQELDESTTFTALLTVRIPLAKGNEGEIERWSDHLMSYEEVGRRR